MRPLVLASAAAIVAASCGHALAAPDPDLLRRIDALERENRQLRARLERVEPRRPEKGRRPSAARPDPASAVLVAVEPRPASSFDGAYVGATLGYSTSDRQAGRPTASGPIAGVGATPSLSLGPDGFVGGGLIGYGQTIGLAYLGAEARANASGRGVSRTFPDGSSAGSSLPFPLGGGSSSTPFPPDPGPAAPFLLGSSQTVRREVASLASTDVSGRLGLLLQPDLMAYGRLGGGFEVFEATSTRTVSTTTCTSPQVVRMLTASPTVYTYFDRVVGCSASASTIAVTRRSGQGVSPYLMAGLGLEKTFDRFFVRGEVDLIGHLGSRQAGLPSTLSFGQFYDLQFIAAFGYRW